MNGAGIPFTDSGSCIARPFAAVDGDYPIQLDTFY
jgi:hypothetical protein